MIWGREPALFMAAISAVIALAVGFGLHITTEQMGLIMAATAAIVGFIVRQNVASITNLQERTPSTVASLNTQGIKVIAVTPDK
jgi:hypothetical protein